MTTDTKGKSKAPLIAIILLVVAGGAAGVWYMTVGRKSPAPTPVAQTRQAPPVTTPEPAPAGPELPVEEPIITEIPGVDGEQEQTPVDDAEAARRKAIEDEVNRRLQEEMRKLQEEYDRQIKKEQEAAAAAAPPPPQEEKPKPQEPDPQAAAKPEEPAPAPATSTVTETTETTAPATETVAEEVAPPPPPPPVKPAVKEGDLVVSSELDSLPSIARRVDPIYPPIAARRKISALVIVSALIDENGKVIDAKVLRGDAKNLGFDDASLRAIRKFTFNPGTKDGKKVKTWYSVPFIFGKQN